MMRSKRRRTILVVTLSILTVGALITAFVLGRKATVVEVANVERGVFERHVEEDGRARVRERFVVSAPLAGTVERSALEVGDVVVAGATIAALHPVPAALHDPRTRAELEHRVGAAEAALGRARAAARRAEVARAHAQKETARNQSLVASGTVSATEVEHAQLDLDLAIRERDEARAAVHVAEHELATAEAAVAASRKEPADMRERFEVTSPIDGVVLQIHHESEGPVAIGTPLLELADPRGIEVVVDLLSTDAVRVSPGAPAEITRWGGTGTLPARVRRVTPRAVVKLSALGVEEERVDVVLDPTERTEQWSRVGDGYRVDVRIPIERIVDTLRIPTSALFREGGYWCVFVVEGDRVRRRVIEVSGYGPLDAAVAAGVEEGEQVVVRPNESLRDEMRVDPVPAEIAG